MRNTLLFIILCYPNPNISWNAYDSTESQEREICTSSSCQALTCGKPMFEHNILISNHENTRPHTYCEHLKLWSHRATTQRFYWDTSLPLPKKKIEPQSFFFTTPSCCRYSLEVQDSHIFDLKCGFKFAADTPACLKVSNFDRIILAPLKCQPSRYISELNLLQRKKKTKKQFHDIFLMVPHSQSSTSFIDQTFNNFNWKPVCISLISTFRWNPWKGRSWTCFNRDPSMWGPSEM